jgi:hypothetical protein
MPGFDTNDYDGLTPLLIAGYGRSGTTALMALLGTDNRVLMGRAYPFEARPLSYAAKMALLMARNAAESHVSGERFFTFEDCGLGVPPWLPPGSGQAAPGDIESPPALEWFRQLWGLFDEKKSPQMATAGSYRSPSTPHHSPAWHAEKVAAWVPAFVRLALPAKTLYLSRDPRDMFLSSNALMRQRNYFSFGRGPGDSDLDHARNLTYEILLYFENYLADNGRADCTLVPYSDLVRDLDGLADRLQKFAGLHCQVKEMPDGLEFHRTASSPEKSIDRWRQEPLPKGVSRFLETYLQELFAVFGYEFSNNPRSCPGVEFARGNDQHGNRISIGLQTAKIDLPLDPFQASIFSEIWVSLHGPGLDRVSLSWKTENEEYSNQCQLSLPWYGALHWRVLRFPFGRQENWKGKITGLRLELTPNSVAKVNDAAYVRWVRLVE